METAAPGCPRAQLELLPPMGLPPVTKMPPPGRSYSLFPAGAPTGLINSLSRRDKLDAIDR